MKITINLDVDDNFKKYIYDDKLELAKVAAAAVEEEMKKVIAENMAHVGYGVSYE